MTSAEIRAQWIASHARLTLEQQTSTIVGGYIAGFLPEVPEWVVADAVRLAIKAIDDRLSEPVKVQAQTIKIKDHR
jgi:hypothetical protein